MKIDENVIAKLLVKDLNLRVSEKYDTELLGNLLVTDWRYKDEWRMSACIFCEDDCGCDESKYKKVLQMIGGQMVAPTAKTRFGKWLVKKICQRM
jgi:hypothetical protein